LTTKRWLAGRPADEWVATNTIVRRGRAASVGGSARASTFCIPSLLVNSDGISRGPRQRRHADAPAAQPLGAAGRRGVAQDVESQWLWARFDAGADAVVAGLVAVWLQLGVSWMVHATGLALAAGAVVIIRPMQARLVEPNPDIPSLLVISDGTWGR
jgi:hypothetical protein